jgi:Papain family cysteine protease
MTRADVSTAWPDFTPTIIVDTTAMPVRDQGARGTCLAFAMSAAHEHCRETGKALSPEYLYWAAKRRDGAPATDGTTIGAAVEALRHDGQPLESMWPYEPHRVLPSSTYVPPSMSPSALFRRTSTTPALSMTLVTDALSIGKLPVMAIEVTTHFFNPIGGRVDPSPARVEGAHAVVAVGYGQARSLGLSLIIRNSWSTTWGVKGHALVPTSYLSQYLFGLVILD